MMTMNTAAYASLSNDQTVPSQTVRRLLNRPLHSRHDFPRQIPSF